jgi:hypothetical protein
VRVIRVLIVTIVAAVGSLAGLNVLAADYAQSWGPAVGSRLPLLEAPDQAGRLRTLENLSGEQGLLLFLSRSADW